MRWQVPYRMVSRAVACWLIALVLAPFTAPFPTCDLAALFGCSPDLACAPATPKTPHSVAIARGGRPASGSLRISRRMRGDEPDVPGVPAELTKDFVVLTTTVFLSARSRLSPVLRATPFASRLLSLSLSRPRRGLEPIRDIRLDSRDTVLRV